MKRDLSILVDFLIEQHIREAQAKHKPYSSQHEAYALLKEEIEECSEEIDGLRSELEKFWYRTKNDDDAGEIAKRMIRVAKALIVEAAQVAVVAERFLEKG